jgi:hypothetical protein
MRVRALFLSMVMLGACDESFAGLDEADAPTDLTYRLVPSGDPDAPAGILLEWYPPSSNRATSYDIYARSSTRDDYGLRATTTSPSFHDAGYPQLQYYVVAVGENGDELGESNRVTVDERNRLQAPAALASVTLNRGVQLSWGSNAYDAKPDQFDFYRVYSTSWGQAGCEADNWALEGTTVSEEFVSRNLANGTTRCFAVSAISRDGHESVWSNVRQDTPRYDARSIVLDAADVRRASSGFVVMSSASAFGTVVADTTTGADFVLERRDGALWLRAARAEARIAMYGVSPVSELWSIDRAPVTGYGDAIKVLAGYGYVARLQHADGVRHAALRIVHVSADYVLFDFALQTQVGSTELRVASR